MATHTGYGATITIPGEALAPDKALRVIADDYAALRDECARHKKNCEDYKRGYESVSGELQQAKADLAKAQELNQSLAARVAEQSELLSKRAESPDIKPGDVVRLKSGGPDMTVESIEDGRAWLVRWGKACDYDNHIWEGHHVNTLAKVEQPK
jgi:uncharacterized protein YodC (DUF2158 family)